jgi:hypothetical protein
LKNIERERAVSVYLSWMADVPREVGRQIAELQGERAPFLESSEEIVGTFGVNSILVVISYWRAQCEKHEECDGRMRAIAERVVSEYQSVSRDFQNPQFLPSLREICRSAELLVENGIDREKVRKLRQKIGEACETVRLQLLLLGQPSDSPLMSSLRGVIEASGDSPSP